MSPHRPLRRLLTGLLVLATFATAAAGVLLRTQVVGIALIVGAALCATCAWYALGAPVRRRDLAAAPTSRAAAAGPSRGSTEGDHFG
jgi:hypothetical protein